MSIFQARPRSPSPSPVSSALAPSLPALLPALLVLATAGAAVAQAPAPEPAGAPAPWYAAVPTPAVQDTGKVLTVEDYARWRVINEEALSSDGRWVAWVYRHTNVARDDQEPELHIVNLDTERDTAIAGASGPEFSPDGRWVAYQVDPEAAGDGEDEPGETGGSDESGASPSTGNDEDDGSRIELRELATGRTLVWHDMQAAEWSRDSKYALIRDRAPRGGSRFGGGSPPAEEGSDAVLVELASGRGHFLGSVGDAAFNRAGTLLAYTVNAENEDANGLFLMDLATRVTTPVDNAPRIYSQLAWNEDGTGLAVLKGHDVEDMLHRDNVLLVVPDVRRALRDSDIATVTLDTTATGFPDGWVISDRASLEWSEDGRRVFLGALPRLPASDTATVEASDSTADVDVWATSDRYVQSVQMSRADRDRSYPYIQALDVRQGTFTALSDSTLRTLEVGTTGEWAVGMDERAYVSDWRPPRADFYRVNTATGERRLMLEGQLTRHDYGISPDGRTFLYWDDEAFHAYDLAEATATRLGPNAPVFTDTVWDYTGPRPPWGVAGYTADGESVIVEDRYDLWTLPLDGGEATSITGGWGADNRIVLRLVRPEPIDPLAPRAVRTGAVWDLSEPVTLSAFGELTKRDGYYRLSPRGRLSEVVYEDAWYGTPEKAARADRFLFTRQTFTEAPDLHVSDRDFADAEQITRANPHDAEYRWGRSVLFDFTDRYGHPLQGLLWLPEDYQEGERRPMIVAFYEEQSYRKNRYPMPELFVSAGRASIEAVSRGYIVMLPDVHYHTGSSHTDQLDAVESATRKVMELGYADPDRIGLQGHSYSGEGAQFIGTQSELFAGVVAGAGVTDLYTDFSQHWGWTYQIGGSGYNGSGYYMYSQGRWGFSPWDRPEVYRSESALSHAHEAEQPFLIMHGTTDPTVSFNESLKFYNALRFNEKTAWLLAYRDEGHHLSDLGNRIDFTTRFFQFFGHYLRDEPAPDWMTRGVPFLEKTGTPEGAPESGEQSGEESDG